MQKVVIDGANGYVASHFIKELLSRNYEVVALVRDNGTDTSEERMHKMMLKTGSNMDHLKNLKVYSYSLLDENFNLQDAELQDIFDKKADFFHFAASLKFTRNNRSEIFETNVDGTESAIKVFLDHAPKGSRFFFVGTVYSCGKHRELFREDFYPDRPVDEFRNYYEQSKRYAENVVQKYIRERGLDGYVIRLSQVVGNNQTGETLTDYGIFDFIKRIHAVSANHPGQTVRIKIDPEGTQNLISIDSTVSYLLKLLQIEKLARVINMVGKKSMKNGHLVQMLCSMLPINLVLEKHLDTTKLTSLERLISAGMSFTGMYASQNLLFETNNLDKYFSPNGNEVTRESLNKMMKYFITHLNGKARRKSKVAVNVNLQNGVA